jgi:hypothetical protein
VPFSANATSALSDPVQVVHGSSDEWKVAPANGHQVAVRRYST